MPVTNAESFLLTYEFMNRENKITCQKFVVDGKTIVHAPMPNSNGLLMQVHVFFDSLCSKLQLFRFPFENSYNEDEAKSIMAELEIYLKPKV